ncbi:hypothetical protein D3C83_59830 [compost metagenome]
MRSSCIRPLGSTLFLSFSTSSRWKRESRNGVTPPLWEKIHLMSGYFAAPPWKIRLIIVRVVSTGPSIALIET